MGDEEAQCKVEYTDGPDGPEETNWIKRAGNAKVTYVNGSTFEGTFDAEKIKQGAGVYVWMGAGADDDESQVPKAKYEGNYKDGARNGVGRMEYPGGDIYEGEWLEGKMHGEGSYTYKNTGDIYSGTWKNNQKDGYGRYEFGADKSMLVGTWKAGELVNGSWELKNFANYEGSFKAGRPLGKGKFVFKNGYKQEGTFAEVKAGEDEAEAEEGAPAKVEWKGDSIVTF